MKPSAPENSYKPIPMVITEDGEDFQEAMIKKLRDENGKLMKINKELYNFAASVVMDQS